MKKLLNFLFAVNLGIWMFYIGGYYSGISSETRTLIKITNFSVSLIFYFSLRFQERDSAATHFTFAYTLVSGGFLLAWITRYLPYSLFQFNLETAAGWAIIKGFEALSLVLPALLLIPLLGDGFQSVYLSKGNIGKSLVLGIGMISIVFIVFSVTGDILINLRKCNSVIGWIVLFSAINAFMEELLFRGLFLRKLSTLLTPFLGLLVTSIVFAVSHFSANYLGNNGWMMVLMIFLSGLGNGAIMQRSDSIWGAVLAHFVTDVLLLSQIFAA